MGSLYANSASPMLVQLSTTVRMSYTDRHGYRYADTAHNGETAIATLGGPATFYDVSAGNMRSVSGGGSVLYSSPSWAGPMVNETPSRAGSMMLDNSGNRRNAPVNISLSPGRGSPNANNSILRSRGLATTNGVQAIPYSTDITVRASRLLFDYFQEHSTDGVVVPFSRYALLIHRMNRHSGSYKLQDCLAFFRNRHGTISELAHRPLMFNTFVDAVLHYLKNYGPTVTSVDGFIEAVLPEITEDTVRHIEILARDDSVYCAVSLDRMAILNSDISELFRVLTSNSLIPEAITSPDRVNSSVGSTIAQTKYGARSVSHQAIINRFARRGLIPNRISVDKLATVMSRRSSRLGYLKFHEFQQALGALSRRVYGADLFAAPMPYAAGTPDETYRKGAADAIGDGNVAEELQQLVSLLLTA